METILKIVGIIAYYILISYIQDYIFKPRVKYNNRIAKIVLGGFSTITICAQVLTKKSKMTLKSRDKNHELIHAYQWDEITSLFYLITIPLVFMYFSWLNLVLAIFLPLVMFYIVYLLDFVISLILGLFTKIKLKDLVHDAYHNQMLEVEAYGDQYDNGYLDKRIPFCWIRNFGNILKTKKS